MSLPFIEDFPGKTHGDGKINIGIIVLISLGTTVVVTPILLHQVAYSSAGDATGIFGSIWSDTYGYIWQ